MTDSSLVVPVWCPMCRSIMKGLKSNITYYNYNCCIGCFIQFIEGREKRWKDGWRPSKEEIDKFVESLDQ